MSRCFFFWGIGKGENICDDVSLVCGIKFSTNMRVDIKKLPKSRVEISVVLVWDEWKKEFCLLYTSIFRNF